MASTLGSLAKPRLPYSQDSNNPGSRQRPAARCAGSYRWAVKVTLALPEGPPPQPPAYSLRSSQTWILVILSPPAYW